jgi:SAM-dependent methyltransferase
LLADLAEERDEIEFVGLDVDPKMVDHARGRRATGNVRFELVDLAEDRPELVADFAFSIDVLHHVHALRAFLRGLHDVLRPGGAWLAIEPNLYHPYIFWSQERMRRAGFDEDHFRPRRAEPLFRELGFVAVERRYAFLFPGWVERVPGPIARLEPPLERFRILGASVVYLLERG